MKISVLVVTNRPVFREFLEWNYRKQTYFDRELIVVEGDGSIGVKRNKALELATGEIVTFFDDDDLQNPRKLEKYAEAFEGNADIGCVSWDHGTFLHLQTRAVSAYRAPNHVVAINSAIRRSAIKVPFPDRQVGEDTHWHRELRVPVKLLEPFEHSIWLVHGLNTCAHRVYNWKIPSADQFGPWFDRDTEEQLTLLESRVSGEVPTRKTLKP